MTALTLPMTVGVISNEPVTTAAGDTVVAATELMDSEGIGALAGEQLEDAATVIWLRVLSPLSVVSLLVGGRALTPVGAVSSCTMRSYRESI